MVSVTFLGFKFAVFITKKLGKLIVNSTNFAHFKWKTHHIFHATKLRGEGKKKEKEKKKWEKSKNILCTSKMILELEVALP
jgi:hypothetical protein